MLQIGYDAHVVLPDLKLNSLTLQWDFRIKYLGVWIFSGKGFNFDVAINSRLFLSFVNSVL